MLILLAMTGINSKKNRRFKKISNKTLLFAWFLLILITIGFGYDYYVKGTGYMPVQPVAFSHRSHIEKYEIKCIYCHWTVETSKFASVPTTKACLVCHIALKNETKLMAAVNESFEKKLPLKWNRIYRLPDYTRFDHSRHIRAQIDCSSCHGEVEKMDTLYRIRELTMKWCLDCHRNPELYVIPARKISGIYSASDSSGFRFDTQPPLTEPFFGEYAFKSVIQKIKGIPSPKYPGKGSETCTSCHY
ncbi:MAG: hypothetical protein QG635_918 [Bacteroidota bacterium]|nr:hypothetical protein [Bacteroidota bacterium]